MSNVVSIHQAMLKRLEGFFKDQPKAPTEVRAIFTDSYGFRKYINVPYPPPRNWRVPKYSITAIAEDLDASKSFEDTAGSFVLWGVDDGIPHYREE